MSTATLQTPPQAPVSLISKAKRARPLFDPPIVKRAIWDSFVKLNPATLWKNPVMFVVEIGSALTAKLLVRDRNLRSTDLPLAVVHGPVRQFRRGHGGGPRESPSGEPAQDQDRIDRQA